VARYVVDVMPKREILDPQGKAVLGALPRLGFEGVADVRQGKRFEVEVDGEHDDASLADVRRMAETLLANPVIEDFTVTLDEPPVVTGEDTQESPPVSDLPGEDTQEVAPVSATPEGEGQQ
jgi:phosphoribosylformylglycinamidine synthase PurS subunit